MADYLNLELADFARLFGTSTADFSEETRSLVAQKDFQYRVLAGKEREQVFLQILKKLDSREFSISGKERQVEWEKGWSEKLAEFIAGGHDFTDLIPRFVRTGETLRLEGNFIFPHDARFDLNFRTVFYSFLFDKYLKNAGSIWDFGCGTGYTLVMMAKMFPEKQIHGLDWAAASAELVAQIAKAYNLKLTGHRFDMFSPDCQLKLDKGSAVLTLNSLEQLGDGYEPFLKYLLNARPALCVNSEPMAELYNPEILFDYVALKYHNGRNYLGYYLTRLKELATQGKIEILKVHRVPFGILYHEGFSYVVWRPL